VAHLTPPIAPPTSGEHPAAPASPSGTGTAQTETAPATPPQQITIERTDHPSPPEDAWHKGDDLRSQGMDEQSQGQYAEAVKSFRSAIHAYETAKTEHPDHEKAIDGDIDALQARIRVCEKHAQ
jgi:hypothetical protein